MSSLQALYHRPKWTHQLLQDGEEMGRAESGSVVDSFSKQPRKVDIGPVEMKNICKIGKPDNINSLHISRTFKFARHIATDLSLLPLIVIN